MQGENAIPYHEIDGRPFEVRNGKLISLQTAMYLDDLAYRRDAQKKVKAKNKKKRKMSGASRKQNRK